MFVNKNYKSKQLDNKKKVAMKSTFMYIVCCVKIMKSGVSLEDN